MIFGTRNYPHLLQISITITITMSMNPRAMISRGRVRGGGGGGVVGGVMGGPNVQRKYAFGCVDSSSRGDKCVWVSG